MTTLTTYNDLFLVEFLNSANVSEITINEEEAEMVRVWQNHPENVKEGSPRIEIEYCGQENAYTWQTVKQYS